MAKVIRDSDNDNALNSRAADGSAHILPFGQRPLPNDPDSASAVACISDAGVEVQFLAPQSDPHTEPAKTTVLISEGSAGKGSAQIAGTTGVLGVAWLEEENGTAVIKLRGITPEGVPFGSEISIGASKLNNHSFSIDGLEFASNGRIDPAAVGINVIWVESMAGDSSGIGRILMERYRVAFDESGKPVELIAASVKPRDDGYPDDARPPAATEADNDNAVWVGDEAGRGFGGVFGFDPAITCLQTGDILVSWIGQDNHVRGKLYPPHEEVFPHRALPADVSQTVSHDINSALGDLGAAAPSDGDNRRLQCVELAPGNFAIMWIALASSGLQLNGQIFSTTRHSDDVASTADWVRSKINPIVLPKDSSGEFSLSATGGDNPDLVVTYAAANSTIHEPEILTLRVDSLAGHQDEPSGMALRIDAAHGREPANDGIAETHLATQSPNVVQDRAGSDATIHPKAASAPSPEAGTPTPVGSGFAVAATSHNETSPIIATTETSLIIAWETPGPNPGTATISMKIYPSHGITVDDEATSGTAIEVTRNADPDIAPAISGLGAGAIAAWIDASSGALTAQTFDENGRAFGPGNGIAVGSVGAVSEIAITSLTLDAAPSGRGSAAAGVPTQPDDQFAIVWVENANAHGYGNIMLQRYGVPHDRNGYGQSPVELGRDGQIGGNNVPEQLTVASDAGLLSAEGRAPQAIGLKHGALALAWVEGTSSGEQIRGEVIEPRGGEQVLLIDLQFGGSSHLEQNTRPILTSTDGNDILISWLQPDGAGGFDLTTARYTASGPDTWTPPEHAVRFQHFDSEPKDFSVVAVGNENASLVVTWWENHSGSGNGNHALGQRFDLMGNAIGDVFDLTGGKQQDADDMSDSAGLRDGHIVIVLTEENGTGDRDIVAYAFDTSDSGTTAHMGLPETALGNMTTLGADGVGNGQSSESSWDGTQSSAPVAPESVAVSADLSNASSDPAAHVAISNTVISAVDSTDGITIDLLPENSPDFRIFAIDGVAVETPADLDEFAAPVRVTDGFVQLRGDGLILFSPDTNFDGSATFDCAVTSASTGDATIAVTINVATGSASNGTDSDPAIAINAKRDDVLHDYEQDNIFDFKKGYGNDAPANDSRVIDMSSSGYATFEALRDAGALAQVGDDVVITLNPADPPNSDKVTLKFASLHTLEATDFKF